MAVTALDRHPGGTETDAIREARIDLAAAFRWTARLGIHEGVANHFSLAVSDDGSRFLMNPKHRHFSRIRASDLLLLDANDPDTMNRPDAPDPTAWCIHGAMHRANPNVRCLLHLHPKYATALACLKDPSMPPIDQNTARFHGRIAFDDGFGGMGLGDEAERLANCLGNKSVLLMGNHGIMVTGSSVAQAFDELYYFEKSCETLITALSTGRELNILSDDVAQKTCQEWLEYPGLWDNHLKEIRAILDDEEPDYRD
ncbi:MAG: class II aldolase and adducin N-terminal domain-containing protein [Rhodospirillales bacterium]